MKVGLVEAGLTSYRLFDPFPEELIRRHAEKRVDYLFAPGEVPAQHLMQKRLAGQVVNTGYNTGRDALAIIENLNARQRSAHPVRAVMTLHRAETLSRPARLKKIVDHVVRLAPAIGPVEFYIHEPTRRSLARMGLLNELEQNDYFRLSALGSYPEFTRALASAHYVLTDGGSIQEEAAYLGKPCLILRKTTERKEGLARTAMLTSFDKERDLSFLRNVAVNSVPPDFDSAQMSASKLIVDTVT
jgi:UDP-N-acetylglucosamine 2-epimerase